MSYSAIKWVGEDQCHLTLVFLGDVAVERLPLLTTQLRQVCAGHKSMTLRSGPLGAFPSLRRASVIWLGINNGASELIALQGKIQQAVSEWGGRTEERAFHPHLTLARIKPAPRSVELHISQELSSAAQPSGWQWQADEVHLIQSVLSPSGPSYKVLERFSLSVH
jgi:2'-5' RNA ligase